MRVQKAAWIVSAVKLLVWVLHLRLIALCVPLAGIPYRELRCAPIVLQILITVLLEPAFVPYA